MLGPQSEAGMAVLSSPLSNGIVTSTPFHPQTSVSEPVPPVDKTIHSQPRVALTLVTSVQQRFTPSHSTVTSHPSHMYLSSSGTRTAPQSSPNTKQVQHMTPGSSQPSNSTTDQLSIDSVALLKRVSVPKFSGNKKNYQAWKAAFYSCVNQTRATPEYKLLRMRECLQGEALKVVENLGHCRRLRSSKTRLERKYGGTRRALTLRLEELDAFRPIREGNEKDLEGFAELLDAVVVNLTDAGQEAELGNGSLYITLQRKFNRNLLTKYKQWISDKCQNENVATLREFIDRESEFLTTASETITGVLKESAKKERTTSAGRTFVTQNDPEPKKRHGRNCKVCDEPHGLWACDSYKRMTVNHRWDVAKDHKLCFRCLGDGHRGESCGRSRVCGINGCKSSHQRMLHGDKVAGPGTRTRAQGNDSEKETADEIHSLRPLTSGAAVEGELNESSHTTIMMTKPAVPSEFVALRTVPVYLSKWDEESESKRSPG